MNYDPRKAYSEFTFDPAKFAAARCNILTVQGANAKVRWITCDTTSGDISVNVEYDWPEFRLDADPNLAKLCRPPRTEFLITVRNPRDYGALDDVCRNPKLIVLNGYVINIEQRSY